MSTLPLVVTFEDIDPVIHYEPYPHGVLSGGWMTFFPSNQFVNAISGSQQGIGNSVRRTQYAGATLSFEFYGTTIELYGAALDSEYTVSLDGAAATPGSENNGLLAAYSDLPPTAHTILLTVVTARPRFDFDKAVFSFSLQQAYTNQTVIARQWERSGSWSELTVRPAIDERQIVWVTSAQDATTWLSFQGTMILVYGNLMSDHGQYAVTLGEQRQELNGTALGLVQNTLLYFKAGLDPVAFNLITMRNMDRRFFDIERAVIISTTSLPPPAGSSGQPSGIPTTSGAQPTSPADGGPSPAGAIVGGAIGGLVGATLLVLLFFVLYVRYKRRRTDPAMHLSPQQAGMLEVSPYVVPPSTPPTQWQQHPWQQPGQTWQPPPHRDSMWAPPSEVPTLTDSDPVGPSHAQPTPWTVPVRGPGMGSPYDR